MMLRSRSRRCGVCVFVLVAGLLGAACFDRAAREYQRGLERWNEGRFTEAVATLREITRRHPDSPYAPKALFKVARIQIYDLRAFEAGEETLQLFTRLYPRDDLAEEAMEELTVLLFSKRRDYRRAIHECRRFIETFPFSERVPHMHRRIVASHLQLGDFARVRSEATIFLERFPEHELRGRVAYDIVRAYFIEEENDAVVKETRRQLEKWPENDFRSRLWFIRASALEELDRLEEALDAYEMARADHPEPALIDARLETVAARLERKSSPQQQP